MGYAGKLEEKREALQLRRQGLSYSEIQEKVSVSKDTLSRWCRDVILKPSQMERLTKRRLEGAERGRILGAKKQQRDRIRRTKKLIREGKKEIGRLSRRDRFIAGTALYLGDGYKSDKSVGFSNSNPQVISFMMKWLREFCQIPEDKFRGQIWIHEDLSELRARRFWAKITRIPINQFQKSYIAENKKGSRKVRKKLHKYGVFAIRVSNAETQRKILGWMSGILSRGVV